MTAPQPAAPSGDIHVYVLTISHRHGEDATVHPSAEDAEITLGDYARQWWHEIVARDGDAGVTTPPPFDDAEAIRIYFAHQPGEAYTVTPALMPVPGPAGSQPAAATAPASAAQPRFRLDEDKARQFLDRAMRRWAGDLDDGEDDDGAPPHENWTLRPGWDLTSPDRDEIGWIENLVSQARDAGALTCTAPGVDIDLVVEDGGDTWMYLWHVTFPAGAGFALCSPGREELRRIGWCEDGTDVQGVRVALGILREAEALGNQLLTACAAASGRNPAMAA